MVFIRAQTATRGTCAKKAQEVWAPKNLSSFKPQNTERFRFWSTNPYNAEIFLHKPWMGKTKKRVILHEISVPRNQKVQIFN